MITFETKIGSISLSEDYLTKLIGNAASSCFGVAGMSAAGAPQGLLNRIARIAPSKQGVRVRYQKSKLVIELHIVVTYGTNVAAIVKSIMNKVQYTVEEITGFPVAKVNVFVDGMKTQ